MTEDVIEFEQFEHDTRMKLYSERVRLESKGIGHEYEFCFEMREDGVDELIEALEAWKDE